MKFLVDAHLPPALAVRLRVLGHDVLHTQDLPAQNRTKDGLLNEISLREQRVLITKDADFFYSYMSQGRPWKLLLVCTGNIGTAELCSLLQTNLSEILTALTDHGLIEVDRTAVRVLQ